MLKYFEVMRKPLTTGEFNDHLEQIRSMILRGFVVGSSDTYNNVVYTICSIEKNSSVIYCVQLEEIKISNTLSKKNNETQDALTRTKSNQPKVCALYEVEKNTVVDYVRPREEIQ